MPLRADYSDLLCVAKKKREDDQAKRDATDRNISEFFTKGATKVQPKAKVCDRDLVTKLLPITRSNSFRRLSRPKTTTNSSQACSEMSTQTYPHHCLGRPGRETDPWRDAECGFCPLPLRPGGQRPRKPRWSTIDSHHHHQSSRIPT